MLRWLKKLTEKKELPGGDLKLYPSGRSCIRKNMTCVSPGQMPPLMVRKPAWRR
jgi:hypothetical protein